MARNDVQFFQFFNFGGFFGVIRHTLADAVMINIFTLITMIVLIGALAAILPLFFMLFYGLLLLLDPPQWEGKSAERNLLSVFTIVACAYFIVDYHYGWLAWMVVTTFFGPTFTDWLCYVHATILIINVFLIIFGHTVFVNSGNGLLRVLVFSAICWFGNKVVKPISAGIIDNTVSQYVPEPGEYPTMDEKYYHRTPPVVEEDKEDDHYNIDYYNE
jgi:hypothetical protein